MKKKSWIAIFVSALLLMGTACKKSGSETEKEKKENWPVEVDLSDCFNVSVDGYDGLGALGVTRNEEELKKEEKRVGEELQEKDMPYRKNDLSDFFESIKFSADVTENLKNDANVVITATYNDSLARSCNVELKSETFDYKVKGLSVKTIIDPFEGLNVKVEGFIGRAKITLDNSGCSEDCKNNVTYNVPDINGNKNSDVVTITADLKDAENFVLSVTEKEVTIDGLYKMYTGAGGQSEILNGIGVNNEELFLELSDKIAADYTEFLKSHDRTVTFKNGEEEIIMTEATITRERFMFHYDPIILTPIDPESLDPNGVIYVIRLNFMLTGKVNGEETTITLDLGPIEYVHLGLVYQGNYSPVVLDESKATLYYSTDFEGPYEYFEPEWGSGEYLLKSSEDYINKVEDELKKTYEFGERPDLNSSSKGDVYFNYTED